MQTATLTRNWNDFLEEKLIESFRAMPIQAFLDKNDHAKQSLSTEEWVNHLTLEALANIDEEHPDWTYVAATIYSEWLYNQAAMNRHYDYGQKYGSLHNLINEITDIGIYDQALIQSYSKDEMDQLEKVISPA